MPDPQSGTLFDLSALAAASQQPRLPLDPTPLSKTNPNLASLRDFILGAIGVRDPLAADASPATGAGAIASMLPIAGAVRSLGRVNNQAVQEIKAIQQARATGTRIATPIKAWHASPHDFDQFSMSKVGSGQGGASFGHGMYAAEHPQVSGPLGSYDREFTIHNLGKPDMNQAEEYAWRRIRDGAGAPTIISELGQSGLSFDDAHAVYERMNTAKAKLYEIDIHASPDEFLDWDKPLSQQSETVQKVLADVAVGAGKNWSGEDIYKSFAGGPFGREHQKATEALKAAGIKGIRYLDQGSRVTGDAGAVLRKYGDEALNVAKQRLQNASFGNLKYWDDVVRQLEQQKTQTSNYVVFDDALIEIQKKFGVSLATAALLKTYLDAQEPKKKGT